MAALRMLSVAGALLTGAGAAHGQSLSTGFNGLTASGSNFWNGAFLDVTALHPDGVTITGWEIDTNRFAGWSVAVRIWVKQGSFVGAKTDESAWTLMGHMATHGVGRGNPLPVTIGNLHIPHNETYGVRIGVHPGSVVFKSAEVTSANPIFANGDLRIDLTNGTVQSSLWVGGQTPRGLNATVHYTIGNAAHFGACCLPDGACQQMNRRICVDAGGTFQGVTTPCSSAACRVGACCLADGSCFVVSPAACLAQSGVYGGDGTTCSSGTCPQPGACCHDGACTRILADRCTQLGGQFRGPGAHCPSNCAILWRPLGAGVDWEVRSLTVYNNQPVANIYRWDGSSWLQIGSPQTFAQALTVDNGALVMGGDKVARWNPQTFTWQQMGANLSHWSGSSPGHIYYPYVYDFAVWNGDLIMGGAFSYAGFADTRNIARWNGTRWLAVGSGTSWQQGGGGSSVNALAVFDNDLIAAGWFTRAGDLPVSNIARWDGAAWHDLGGGANDQVHALALYNGELIAAGAFTRAGDLPANRIAAWNGLTWRPLRAGITGAYASVHALTIHQGELIAGGRFSHADGIPVAAIARWDGMFWRPLGLGVGDPPIGPLVSALKVWGDELLVGGQFSLAGGRPANNIAVWSGSSPAPCYPNCDGSTTTPYLDANDLTCFINQFTAGQTLPYVLRRNHYANCDGSTIIPILTIEDFVCFMEKLARGCP